MPRITCRTYGAGTFAGVTFTEHIVDGKYVGIGETDDEKALAWFRARPGFDVDEPTPEPALEDHTVDELKAIAAEREIDLDGASKKADIITKIRAAADEPAGDEPPTE